MPYRATPFLAGQYYHFYNRGAGRQPIFREPKNFIFALRLIKKYAVVLDITVIAYCLIWNHYHLLLRQDGEKSAGLLPQRVFNSYTKAFNKHYARTGTLFEGRYKAVYIDNESYLLHLCRYIHANPAKHGCVSSLEEWPYSNYHEWIGARHGTLFDRDFVRQHFATAPSYRQFVLDYLAGSGKLPQGVNVYLLE